MYKNVSSTIKPVLLLTLITTLYFFGQQHSQFIWFELGLILSLVAELLELLTKPMVKASFVAFLLAFICYSKAFWLQLTGEITWWLPALLFAASVIVFLLLLPRLDSVIFPGSLMGLVLVQMTWAATAVWLADVTVANLVASIGSAMFILAMLIRGMNNYHFARRHLTPQFNVAILVASCYLLAQGLIVASVVLAS